MPTLASGSRTALRYAREAVRGTTPPAVLTLVTNSTASTTGLASTATSGGFGTFTRTTGSWITDGFVVGTVVQAVGWTNAAINGYWTVSAVTALILTVIDSGAVFAVEAANAAHYLQIPLRTLRATGRNVNLEKNILESAEVDPDGQETDVRHGFNRVIGAPGFQLSRADYDDMLEFACGGTWTAVAAVTPGNYTPTNATHSFTRASGSWITDGFRVGDVVRTSGFADAANNADWRVTALTATVMTVYDPLNVIVTHAAEAGTLIYPGKRLDVRPVMPSFVLERAFLDVMQFQSFNGCVIDQMAVNIQPEAMIGGTLNILGMSAAALTTMSLTQGGALGIVVNAASATSLASASSANSVFVVTRGSGSWITDGFVVGDFVKASGWPSANTNGYWAISAVAALTMTLVSGSVTITGEASGAPNTITLLVSTPQDATGSSPFAAFDGQIFEGGTAIAVATSVNMTLARNRSLNPVIGSKFSPDVFDGTAKLSGTLTAYFQDQVLLNKFINETESTMWFRLNDPNTATEFLSIVYPRIKYTGGQMDPPQQGPVPISMPFKALKKTGLATLNGTTNTLMTLQRSNA